jgi:hypothetical protein
VVGCIVWSTTPSTPPESVSRSTWSRRRVLNASMVSRAASAAVYLGAAALQRPAAAWPLFFATAVVITVARLLDDRFEPTWVILAGAVVLLIYGLLRGAGHLGHGLPLQTAGLVGFGAAAALTITSELGAYLVAAGLLGHAAWDVYHHRTNRVVVRSLAEFCLVLDTALAVAIVIVTVPQ